MLHHRSEEEEQEQEAHPAAATLDEIIPQVGNTVLLLVMRNMEKDRKPSRMTEKARMMLI